MPITTTPSGGPQGEFSTYTPIYSTTLTSAASSITFSNLPLDYTDLVIEVNAAVSASDNELFMQLGPDALDTGNNYSTTFFFSDGSPLATRQTGLAYCNIGRLAVNATQPTGMAVINLMNYANTSTFKPVIGLCGSAASYIYENTSLWRNNSAITTVKLYPSVSTFIAGSSFTIYGIKAATPAPKATGGDSVVTDGTFWYHTFLNTGVFQPTQSLSNVDFLVIAGGGAGGAGNSGGGGGGAGGLRTSVGTSGGGGAAESKLTLTAGTVYPVTVGAGGIGGSFYGTGIPTAVNSTSGSNSTFSTITSTGGGRGGQFSMGTSFGPGANGGSGGGGAGESTGTTAGGTGTANQGYAGGTGATDNATYRSFGGGGGAGGVGSNGGATNNGVAGGVGLSITSLAYPTGTGVSGFYAGGGGGANTNNRGNGGAGGGGAGAVSAVANTGGGGGGVGSGTSFAGNGGSGLVIVRYAV